MSGHTPGPWRVCQEGDCCPSIDAGSDLSVVAPGVWGETEAQEQANARLIAAAPELLEACKAAAWHSLDLPSAVVEQLVDAIEKAIGE